MALKKHTAYSRIALVVCLLWGMLTSCDAMHEDLQPCPQGVRLRFVYDYNMEFANAFPSQVDCLVLYVFDAEGRRVGSWTADQTQTSDEDWRMTLPLPEGRYTCLAYGGMTCDNSSFRFDFYNDSPSLTEMNVSLKPGLVDVDPGHNLHPLFYGDLEVEVPSVADSKDYVDATVYMMKDTNNIRLVLSGTEGSAYDVSRSDFDFRIIDDNTRLNYLNQVVPTGDVTYWPWASGDVEVGLNVGGEPFTAAYAEFSTSRLMARSGARLLVTRRSDGGTVIDAPLVNLLELMRSEAYAWMSPQEYLDRESRWNLTFFITQDGRWLTTTIVINDWVIRINNIDDLN